MPIQANFRYKTNDEGIVDLRNVAYMPCYGQHCITHSVLVICNIYLNQY